MLSDGHTLYTPGLSENAGGTSRYYSNDRLGNLWTIDGSAKSQAYYQDTTAFGIPVAQAGSGSVFGFGGGNGCQTDADIDFVLMGHRYYDPRTGRFISQDPIGDGDNWYAYADNNPVNETDSTGLSLDPDTPGVVPYSDGSYHYPPGDPEPQAGGATFSDDGNGHVVEHSSGNVVVSSWKGFGMGGGMGPVAIGMLQRGPDGKSNYEYHMREEPTPDMHIWHNGKLDGPETNIDHNGKLRLKMHKGKQLEELPKKLKKVYGPAIRIFLQRAGMAADAIGAALEDILSTVPIVVYYNPHDIYNQWNPNKPQEYM